MDNCNNSSAEPDRAVELPSKAFTDLSETTSGLMIEASWGKQRAFNVVTRVNRHNELELSSWHSQSATPPDFPSFASVHDDAVLSKSLVTLVKAGKNAAATFTDCLEFSEDG